MKKVLSITILFSGLFLLNSNAIAFNCTWDGRSDHQQCSYDYLTLSSDEGNRNIINYALEPGKEPAKLYYQSSGENSGYRGTVFPFYGINETKTFIKPNIGRNPVEFFETNFLNQISDLNLRNSVINELNERAKDIYGANADINDLFFKNAPLKTLIQRLGSLEDAKFSHEFPSKLWDYETDNSGINAVIKALDYVFKVEDSKKIPVIGIFRKNLGTYDMENLSAQDLNNALYNFTS